MRAARVDPARLLQLVDAFSRLRVAVFGDLIVDEFIYGEIARVSREAPVLILNYDSTEIVPGGAGNAAEQRRGTGGSAVPVGFTGRDETGRRLLEAMRPRVDVRWIVRARGVPHADEDADSRGRRSIPRNSRSSASIAPPRRQIERRRSRSAIAAGC